MVDYESVQQLEGQYVGLVAQVKAIPATSPATLDIVDQRQRGFDGLLTIEFESDELTALVAGTIAESGNCRIKSFVGSDDASLKLTWQNAGDDAGSRKPKADRQAGTGYIGVADRDANEGN